MPAMKSDLNPTASSRRGFIRSAALSTATLITVLALSGCSRGNATSERAAPSAPSIPAIRVVAQDLPDVLTFTGRIEAVHRVELRPRVSGPITAICYSEGTQVRAGTPLFRIDPRPYQALRDKAAAELDRARAVRTLATQELTRARRLREDMAVSLEDLDRKVAELATAEAHEVAARAALASAELDLEFTTILAPVDGLIGRALATVGNHVHAGSTHLATLVSVNPIQVLFDVDEPAFQRIQMARRAQTNSIKIQLTTAGGLWPVEGTLDYVANTVDPSTGTAQVRAVVSNLEHRLSDGMFARVDLSLPFDGSRVVVPETALGSAQGSRYLLVATAENTVEHRPVTLGPRIAGQRVIASGIQPDDIVLLGGHQWLRTGMPVQPALQPSHVQTLAVTQH